MVILVCCQLFALLGTVQAAPAAQTPEAALSERDASLKDLLQGKTLSILGDSISTFSGWSDSTAVNSTLGNNKVFFPGSSALSCVEQTWWKQSADRFGMEILVNNSWSSSTVSCANPGEGEASYGWDSRPENLHDNTLADNPGGGEILPDMVAIYMGTNDYLCYAPCPGVFDDGFWAEIEADGYTLTDSRNFQAAYALMVYKVRQRYPDAQVFLFTLPAMELGKDSLRLNYNAAIFSIAEHYGCRVVDLASTPLSSDYATYLFDGKHPNPAGMEIIADAFADALADAYLFPQTDFSGYSIHPGMASYLSTAKGFVPLDYSEGGFAYRYLKIFESTQIHHINVMALEAANVDDEQYITVAVVDNLTSAVKRSYRFYAKAEALGSTRPERIVSLYPREEVFVGWSETLMFCREGDPLTLGYIPSDPDYCCDVWGFWQNGDLTDSNNSGILCIDTYTTAPSPLSQKEEALGQVMQGKKLSILGDSICAYWGISNDTSVNTTLGNNRGWFGNPLLLTSIHEMWWQQMVERYGMELLVNNSWTRCTVTSYYTPEGEDSYGWNTRPMNLHDNTLYNNPDGKPINPDIIVIYLGFNDIRGGVSCETSFDDSLWEEIEAEGYIPPATSDFHKSYALMVYKVCKTYPDAQVYIFNNPVGGYPLQRQTYNKAIAGIAEHYGCYLVDLYDTPFTNYKAYTFDGVHPTAAGMSVMADIFAEALAETNLGLTPEAQPGTPNYTPPANPPELSEQYRDYTGLARGENNRFYYYIKGTFAKDYTGLVENAAGRWYVKDGEVQLKYNGTVRLDGTKYLIKGGSVWAFTGIKKMDGVWTYFDSGVNDLNFKGLVACNGMLAYVENGEVNFGFKGLAEADGKIYYVKYGIWYSGFKGVAKNADGEWIVMMNGVFDPSYVGAAKVNGYWVYASGGVIDFGYSGVCNVNGVDYTVKHGYIYF